METQTVLDLCVTVFLFSKSKEIGEGEGEAERREGAGALVRVSSEGECYSVRELGVVERGESGSVLKTQNTG